MSLERNKTKFSIHGKSDKRFGYFMFLLVAIALPGQFIFAYYKGYLGDTDFWGIGPFVLAIAVTIGAAYAGYYFIATKTLEIDERGVRYIFNKKIKKEISWREIQQIQTQTNEEKTNFYLGIDGLGKKISFTTIEKSVSKEDLQRAFYELLRYQPLYNFVVDDELGWSKLYERQNENISRVQQQPYTQYGYPQQEGKQW